ncbi:UDP-N-acetylglucosamine--N-acetylmuramyl-(pentapeptide) pyrophosphoryl-undecaprenol N-acetylglucosamine transferase [Patescibacteria group bacterium]|nr:UDP-N-acetylglucosamine--N-acetylmuramyl-(pentapeptide) pyrophosphoryl-undecaprenol N-acetylglucosamine transferase [Patescibacteria group bacterium]
MKILITGGHLAPALAVIEELRKTKPETEIVFVGRKYALDSEKTVSLEYKEINKRNINFIPLQAGRLTRIFSLRSLRSFFRIPLGFINSFFIVSEQRPNLIMSFGGYVALPVVFWGFVFGKPIFTHEQTIRPGLANKIIGFFSKKIFITFGETKKFFDPKKTIVTGNPVRQSIYSVDKKPFSINKDRPVIYITGGALGSHSVNEHVKKIIAKLLVNYIVIHQTGETKEYHDFEDLALVRNRLPKELSDRYFLRKHFFEDEIGYVYSLADLVVGRAGANTFFELINLRKPAVFIPLPWASGKEQQFHAEIFAKNQTGEIFHQIETSGKLLRLIDKMMEDIGSYKKNFQVLSQLYKKNASQFIAKEILNQAS